MQLLTCYIKIWIDHCFVNVNCLFRKPKNQRVKRALEKREPKIYENDKTAVFVRGGHTSEIVTQFLAELVFSLDYIILVYMPIKWSVLHTTLSFIVVSLYSIFWQTSD